MVSGASEFFLKDSHDGHHFRNADHGTDAEKGHGTDGDGDRQKSKPFMKGSVDLPGGNNIDQDNGAPHGRRGDDHLGNGPIKILVDEGANFPFQDEGEHNDINGRGDGRSQCETAMLQGKHQNDTAGNIDKEGHNGCFHGILGILKRVESRHNHPDD